MGEGIESGIGFLGDLFGHLFGHEKNPYQAALQGILPMYRPVEQAGEAATPMLQQQYAGLTQHPGAEYNQLASGFQTSPGYEFQREQAVRAANESAAAGGMGGTPQAQVGAMGAASQLANKNFQEYMNRVQGLYGTGLSGLGQEEQRGMEAARGIGGLEAQGAQYHDQQMSNMFGHLGSMGGALAQHFMDPTPHAMGYGGGYSAGAPVQQQYNQDLNRMPQDPYGQMNAQSVFGSGQSNFGSGQSNMQAIQPQYSQQWNQQDAQMLNRMPNDPYYGGSQYGGNY